MCILCGGGGGVGVSGATQTLSPYNFVAGLGDHQCHFAKRVTGALCACSSVMFGQYSQGLSTGQEEKGAVEPFEPMRGFPQENHLSKVTHSTTNSATKGTSG